MSLQKIRKVHDRDTNAAINLIRKGMRIIAGWGITVITNDTTAGTAAPIYKDTPRLSQYA